MEKKGGTGSHWDQAPLILIIGSAWFWTLGLEMDFIWFHIIKYVLHVIPGFWKAAALLNLFINQSKGTSTRVGLKLARFYLKEKLVTCWGGPSWPLTTSALSWSSESWKSQDEFRSWKLSVNKSLERKALPSLSSFSVALDETFRSLSVSLLVYKRKQLSWMAAKLEHLGSLWLDQLR